MSQSTDRIRVALLQHRCGTLPAENQNVISDAIRRAAQQGANLIVLQELHDSVYFCQHEDPRYFEWATPIPGPKTEALGDLARKYQVVIVASLFEKRAKGLYHNTAVVMERNGDIAGTYRKMHIPDDPGYYEKYYFTPGDLGFNPIATSLGKLGVLVCWDQWFPEAARLMALAGADLLIYPTAIGWNPADDRLEQERQLDAWITIQRSHAIANAIPVLSCNRIGHEPDPSNQTQGIEFWGASFVTDSMGTILTMAPDGTKPDAITVQIADVSTADTEIQRQNWPFFRDRRTEYYNDILLRYRDKLPH